MEINMENAFYFAIKGSLGPFISSLDTPAIKIKDVVQQQTYKVLEKPLMSTLLIACVMLLVIIALALSTLVVAGVLCIAVIILIVEGFILSMIVGLAVAITASVFLVIIMTIGIISSSKLKN